MALNTEDTEENENTEYRLAARQKREVLRRGHEKNQRKAQPEINLHGQRRQLREICRFGRHRSSLRRRASPSNQSLLASPGNSPHIQEQNRSQPAAD